MLMFLKEKEMPNKDGTGPAGQGPKTGRGLGPCTPKNLQKEKNSRLGNKGRGMGPRNRGQK